MRRLVALAFMLAGCVAGTGGFDDLPGQDRARFTRCQNIMANTLCPGVGGPGLYLTDCLNQKKASYADESARYRKEWLTANGCPASVVDPGAYARTEPPDQPMPRRPAAPAGQTTDEE